jgi:2-iminobutanoate/2-iminopropanoate deaminase
MRAKILLSPSLAALVVLFFGLSSVSLAQQRHAINVGRPKGLPFSDGVLVGNTLYIAGTEGIDESGKLKPGGITPEMEATLDNMGKVLKAAGFDWKDVAAVTVYLADLHDYAEMNKVYKSILPDPKPARATVQVAGLVNNARVEISAIAVKEEPLFRKARAWQTVVPTQRRISMTLRSPASNAAPATR